MVNHNFVRLLLMGIISVQLSGCGYIRNIWGEKAPPRKTVTIAGETLPEITDIFSDDKMLAEDTFNQYKKMALNTFDKIKGQTNNFLSMEEIESLARVGLAKLSDKEELNIARVRSALTLLGFKDGISRDQVEILLKWIHANRIEGKAFYDILIKSDSTIKVKAENLMQLIRFSGSFIALGGGNSVDKSKVEKLIRPWVPENYTHALNALPGGIDLVLSVFSSLCGDRVEADQWNAKKNGECLLALMEHFKGNSSVFNFIFDKINPITQSGELAASNSSLVDHVESWMKDHQHPSFPTQKVATFAEQLDIPSPYHFFKLTEWLPKLNKASNVDAFDPSFFIDLAYVIQNWVDTFIEVTASTKENDSCKFIEWKKCEFTGEYDTADKLFNDEYATLIRNKNLDFIAKISFYDSVADYLIKALDEDGDGLLRDDIKDLIGIAVRLLDSNAFAQNVFARIQEKPVSEVNTENTIKALSRQGLGEVAALAADLIPERGGNKRSILKKLTSQVYDADKYPSYTLDRLGIATFIYVFNLLGSLRGQYMHDYDFEPVVEGTTTWIKRRKVMELLPRMLHDHFPRIYNECLDWGFERTCGVIFSEVLASPVKNKEGKDTGRLEPSDIDMINLTSVLLESMMNRCDRNHNDRLSTNVLDGFDEKHCVLTASRNLATRFMRAKILEDDHTTKTLLNVLKWIPPARWAAKVALERGTLKGIGLRAIPIISLISKPAKLGGVMSLTAEFMDPEKVNAIEAGVEGHHEDAGDELIYLHQLTDHYLPSKEWALRTSAAARILYGPALVTSNSP